MSSFLPLLPDEEVVPEGSNRGVYVPPGENPDRFGIRRKRVPNSMVKPPNSIRNVMTPSGYKARQTSSGKWLGGASPAKVDVRFDTLGNVGKNAMRARNLAKVGMPGRLAAIGGAGVFGSTMSDGSFSNIAGGAIAGGIVGSAVYAAQPAMYKAAQARKGQAGSGMARMLTSKINRNWLFASGAMLGGGLFAGIMGSGKNLSEGKYSSRGSNFGR